MPCWSGQIHINHRKTLNVAEPAGGKTAGNGALIAKYREKTPGSAALFARSAELHVNGVSHNIRFFEPYPFVTESAAGRFLTDVDGNRFADYWMGHWSLILGHAPERVRTAVTEQLARGWMHGTASRPAIGLSEAIRGCVPVAEKIRYTASGTEATMYAVRLARSATGKRVIAKVDGGWHGYASDLLRTVNWPFAEPEGSGLVDGGGGADPEGGHVVSIPYNDLEGSLDVLNGIKRDLAGVIIEPVLGGGGCIPATSDYLRGIQEFARGNGSLFMLDEIVTGFRFRYGCVYTTMGLEPDIVTLGKIAGGGFPIGVICGTDEVMKYADTARFSKAQRSYIGGGTFSANPASMTAGSETLSILKEGAGRIYPRIEWMGRRIRTQLDRIFDGRAVTTGTGSLFMTHFTRGAAGGGGVTNAAQAAACDTGLLYRYHLEMMTEDGIFLLPGKLGAVSDAHTDGDVENLLSASQRFAENNNNV